MKASSEQNSTNSPWS